MEKYSLVIEAVLIIIFIITLKKFKFILKPIDYLIILYLLSIGVNIICAIDKKLAIDTYLFLAAPFFSIYFIISNNKKFIENFGFLCKVICVTSSIVIFIAILEIIFGANFIYEHFIHNPYYSRYINKSIVFPISTQFHPVALGTYLFACLPFGIFTFVKEDRFILRLVWGGYIILNILIGLFTHSRASFLGLICMFLFYAYHKKVNYSIVLVFLLLISVVIIFFPFLSSPFNKLGFQKLWEDYAGFFSTYRIIRFKMGIKMLKNSPLFGIGLANFRRLFDAYYPYTYPVPYEFKIPDNMYLSILSETGLIGFIFFISWVVFFIKEGFMKLRYTDNSFYQEVLLTLMASFIFFLVNIVGYDTFYWYNQYIFFCIIVGGLRNIIYK